MRERADKALVAAGLAPTRSQAQQYIEEGVVYAGAVRVTRPSLLVEPSALNLLAERRYVGRGAHKLEHALAEFRIACADLVCADVGASTGGFTDALLGRGARRVYAIDVGHGQLAAALRADSRVVCMEGVNAKHPFTLPEPVGLAVVDLSFISLRHTLANIAAHVREGGSIVALVKPQFEVGPSGLDKRGVVRDSGRRAECVRALLAWMEDARLGVVGFERSPIVGHKQGNVEYLAHLVPGAASTLGAEARDRVLEV